MELALSLGETQKPFSFLHKTHMNIQSKPDLGFCMAPQISEEMDIHTSNVENKEEHKEDTNSKLLQLDLLPFSPVQRSHHHQPSPPDPLQFPWLTKNIVIAEPISMCGPGLNRVLFPPEEEGDGAALSSPNSGGGGGGGERGGSSRGSDDEDMNNGLARKKLRLSKDQSAYLEESFKEHNTLNPKQKQALARQLNLRPRQVEVWFQNRRARTKLKQTEVDCEYLKRCCETLTEENRRLQKEVQELRALKSSQPFFMNLPATTLTMCPSCERVATTTTTTTTTAAATNTAASTNTSTSLITPRLHSFLCGQVDMQEAGPQLM